MVGILSNWLAYVLYLSIVFFGVGPVIGMSITYLTSCSVSFVANKRWSFQSDAGLVGAVLRYIAVQACGYMTNLLILYSFHYVLGFSHQTAQLIGIAIVAIELFVLNRYYVFA